MTKNLNNLNPYGYVKDGKVFLKGYLDLPDREIGVVRETEEASIQYFVDRYDKFKEKLEVLESQLKETSNKGSYLMKLTHMRTHLHSYNALGDFVALLQQIESIENYIVDYIKDNRIKNKQIKEQLLMEAEELKESSDWEETTEKMREIKMRWIRTGSIGDNEEAFSERFDEAINHFFKRRKDFFERERQESDHRVDFYTKIIEELEHINRRLERVGEEEQKEMRARVITLQRDWKTVGQISKWKYLKLWKRYKREIDDFFNNKAMQEQGGRGFGKRQQPRPHKIFLQPTPTTPAGILKRKEDVCKFVEDINENFKPINLKDIKTLQAEWKQMGIIRDNESDKEYNHRFHSTCSEIFTHAFLEAQVKQTFEGYTEKTSFEQVKLKIKLLKDAIRDDETQLQEITRGVQTDSFGRPQFEMRNPAHEALKLSYMNTLNKIKTEKRILKRFQALLTNHYY
ncbi:DUF349 domain-containing protein [Hugenholtzia roseola]|uniref:DUF349 domain-containing protein n=1 Tax=Hugenholtzia roseola TaxID=1002 RepID=UPI00042100E9|nr:DUF349 domain-containing protein [Hugenholtzia roseola]